MTPRFQKLLDDIHSGPDAGKAQEELYKLAAAKLLEPLRARIPKKARPRLDAEDVLQEALLRAIRGASTASFESERLFLAWVYRIARNFMADQAKRMSAQAMRFQADGQGPLSEADLRASRVPSRARGAATELQRKEDIERALGSLRDSEADVIRRRWLGGQSFEEIAKALRRSRTAIKSLYARAWRRLREAGGRSGHG